MSLDGETNKFDPEQSVKYMASEIICEDCPHCGQEYTTAGATQEVVSKVKEVHGSWHPDDKGSVYAKYSYLLYDGGWLAESYLEAV